MAGRTCYVWTCRRPRVIRWAIECILSLPRTPTDAKGSPRWLDGTSMQSYLDILFIIISYHSYILHIIHIYSHTLNIFIWCIFKWSSCLFLMDLDVSNGQRSMIQSALEKPLDFMVISTQGIQGLRTVSDASYQIQVEFAGMHPASSPFIVFILTTHSLP